ncbi:MYLK3-like protein, partial [Mya arenaria]
MKHIWDFKAKLKLSFPVLRLQTVSISRGKQGIGDAITKISKDTCSLKQIDCLVPLSMRERREKNYQHVGGQVWHCVMDYISVSDRRGEEETIANITKTVWAVPFSGKGRGGDQCQHEETNANITRAKLSGLSPFLGESEEETIANITEAKWDFKAEEFESVSAEAKDFISRLVLKTPSSIVVNETLEEVCLSPEVAESSKRNVGAETNGCQIAVMCQGRTLSI